MATVAKRKLSGSSDGKGILVAQTVTPGTLIHTAVAGVVAGTFDEVWLYVVNSSLSAVKLTIEYGSVTAPDGNIESTIAAESGLVLVIPGLILQNTQIVRAFAATTNVLIIHGFVNTITD
jgi:hypothetical protein